jgi:hypothetical protein
MKKLLLISLLQTITLANVYAQTSISIDSLALSEHTVDSTESAVASEEYSRQLIAASNSDCFCSEQVFFKISIEANGDISKITLLKGTGTCWDDVLAESIKNSSPWIPAKKNGLAIKSEKIIPIHYGTVITYPCNN